MTLLHSKYVRGGLRIPGPDKAGEVVAVRYEYDVDEDVQLATDDIIELGVLPAYMRVVDARMDSDEIDDGTALVVDVGLMTGKVGESLDEDGDPRTCGDELFDGDDLGQAGGSERAGQAEAFRIAPVDYDRSIGVKIATQATTQLTGKIGLTVWYGT